MVKPIFITGVALVAALVGSGCKGAVTSPQNSTSNTKVTVRSDPRPVTPPPSLAPIDNVPPQSRATAAPVAPEPDAPAGDEPECEEPDCGDAPADAEVGS